MPSPVLAALSPVRGADAVWDSKRPHLPVAEDHQRRHRQIQSTDLSRVLDRRLKADIQAVIVQNGWIRLTKLTQLTEGGCRGSMKGKVRHWRCLGETQSLSTHSIKFQVDSVLSARSHSSLPGCRSTRICKIRKTRVVRIVHQNQILPMARNGPRWRKGRRRRPSPRHCPSLPGLIKCPSRSRANIPRLLRR